MRVSASIVAPFLQEAAPGRLPSHFAGATEVALRAGIDGQTIDELGGGILEGWGECKTPAAWALLLSTDALRSQAARLAVGSVQQFVPPEALRSLRVPMSPCEVRDRWQRAVERHHAQRRTQDRQWAALVSEVTALFEAAHGPFAETHPRAKESVQ